MPAIFATAPGKAILFGEHAVVYGRPAIAVPVTQVQAKAVVTPLIPALSGTVRVDAPGISLSASLSDLPLEHPLAAALHGVFTALGVDPPPAMTVRITSTIPVASGLGSGAAVSVAVIRAVSSYLGQPLPDRQVSALAYEVEKIHHGTPSGIDNTVIAFRKPVYFVRGEPIQPIQAGARLTLVIADTGVSSPTAHAVGMVRAGWAQDQAAFEARFDAIGAIANAALGAITAGSLAQIGRLMNENQTLLEQIGVSSPEIERLVKSARSAGALGAKLSGAGCGGNMIALANDAQDAELIAAALRSDGAVHTLITSIE
jgi:mevalonate kinase